MYLDVVEFLIVLGLLSPTIAIAVFVSKPAKGGRLENLLFFYLIASLFFDVLSYILATYYVESNQFALHLYELVICIPLMLIFVHQQNDLLTKRLVYISFVLLTITGVLFFTISELWNESSSYFYTASCMLVTFFCLRYFLTVIKTPQFKHITNDPAFWVNSAFLLYFGTAVFLSLFEVIIFSDLDNYMMIYTPVHLVTYLMSNLALAVALWKTW